MRRAPWWLAARALGGRTRRRAGAGHAPLSLPIPLHAAPLMLTGCARGVSNLVLFVVSAATEQSAVARAFGGISRITANGALWQVRVGRQLRR